MNVHTEIPEPLLKPLTDDVAGEEIDKTSALTKSQKRRRYKKAQRGKAVDVPAANHLSMSVPHVCNVEIRAAKAQTYRKPQHRRPIGDAKSRRRIYIKEDMEDQAQAFRELQRYAGATG